MDTDDKIAGSLYLSAFGDAWGYRTEFINNQNTLTTRYERAKTPPTPAIITDDTQMNIAVLKGIMATPEFFSSYDPEDLEDQRVARLNFIEDFLIWKHDPRNDRAPGMTCLGALDKFEKNRNGNFDPKAVYSGLEGTVKDSKGCGANMRAPWIGLHLGLSDEQVVALAHQQAIVTHGHPFATISASLTALINRKILTGEIPRGRISDYLIGNGFEGLLEDHPAWESFTYYLLTKLEKAKDMQANILDPAFDLCQVFGGGWVAEEAFLLSVMLCDAYLNHENTTASGITAVRRAAHLTGDSDSIACITGAFMGAFIGKRNIPVQWDSWLEDEYRDDLIHIYQFLREQR